MSRSAFLRERYRHSSGEAASRLSGSQRRPRPSLRQHRLGDQRTQDQHNHQRGSADAGDRPRKRAGPRLRRRRCSALSTSRAPIDVRINEVVPAHAGLGSGHPACARGRSGRAPVAWLAPRRREAMPSGSDAARARGSASVCSSAAVSSSTADADPRGRPRRSSAECRSRTNGASWSGARSAPPRRAWAGRARRASASLRRFRTRSGPPLPARPDEGAARARGMRHCRLRLGDQRNAGAAWATILLRFRAAAASPAPTSRRRSTASSDEGAMASVRAPGDRPALPLRRPRRRQSRLLESIAPRIRRCRDLDIRACQRVSIAEQHIVSRAEARRA